MKLKNAVCETEKCSGDRKQKAVYPIHNSAVTGDEVAVVLETCHALYKRSRKVADLTEALADTAGQNAGDEGNVVVRALEHKVQDNTCDHR